MNMRQSGFNQSVKMFFGIFMVFVYLGMAVLLAMNLFDWSRTPLWDAVRWLFVVVFAAYGIYRGYRELKGDHTYGMRTYDDDDQDPGYTTYADRLKKQEGDNDNENQ